MIRFVALVFALVTTAGPLVAAIWHVAPHGDDDHAGSAEAPWASLEKASVAARAGDTVLFHPGIYRGILRPRNSGTAEAPIVFRSVERLAARLVSVANGDPRNTHAVSLDSVEWVEVHGFHLVPEHPVIGRWVAVTGSRHITLRDCIMERGTGRGAGLASAALSIENSSHVRLLDSIVRQWVGGDMAHIFQSDHILIEGCAIGQAGHSPLAVDPRAELHKTSSHLVLRGNVFFAGWGRPFEIFGARDTLMESNVIVHAYHGSRSAGPDAKVMMEHGVYRFNRAFRNWGSPVNVEFQNEGAKATHSRFYHNVFDRNYQQGMRTKPIVDDHVFANNIFHRNDQPGDHRQILVNGDASDWIFDTNAFWGAEAAVIDAREHRAFTLDEVQSEAWQSRHGKSFRGNVLVDPRFLDTTHYNHALQPDSPLIDAGRFLARTVAPGSGTLVRVDDAGWFYDGFGIDGERGDLIAVGSPSNQARVQAARRETNELLLDRPLRWSAGDAVSLPWAGAGPDIGCYEHGQQGRAAVQILTTPFNAIVGATVDLRVVAHGDLKIRSVEWRLGDGTFATGERLRHSFAQSGPAPICVRVTDAAGHEHVAAAFVEVDSPDRFKRPLVDLSFDVDVYSGEPFDFDDPDIAWWYFFYRSRPTVLQTILHEADGNGYGHFQADADNHPLHVRGFPAQWDIDRFPIVRFRYKVQPGLPLGVKLIAFPRIGKVREVYAALSPQASAAAGKRSARTQTLLDDGEWRVIELDARIIRERFPDVTVLEQIRFDSADQAAQVKQGDGFMLDHFSILPAPDSSDRK